MVICLLPSLRAGPASSAYQDTVAPLLTDVPAGSAAIMLTAHPSRIWPMDEQAGLVWPSRYYSFWMFYAVARHEHDQGPLQSQVEVMADKVRANTVEDLLCNSPEIILVDDFSHSETPGLDILAFFRQNEMFARLFAAYGETKKSGDFTAYRRQGDLPSRLSGGCRTVY